VKLAPFSFFLLVVLSSCNLMFAYWLTSKGE